jgi:hypothetical protein
MPKHPDSPDKIDFKTKFLGYQPSLHPLPESRGGGFVVKFEVPETEWPRLQDLNDPSLKDMEFTVILKGKKIT